MHWLSKCQCVLPAHSLAMSVTDLTPTTTTSMSVSKIIIIYFIIQRNQIDLCDRIHLLRKNKILPLSY